MNIVRSICLIIFLISFLKHIEGVSIPSRFVGFDSSERILVAKSSFNSTDFDFALLRYLDTGILDVTFGGINDFGNLYPGMVTTDIEGGDDVAYSMVIDEDQKINVAGSSEISFDEILNTTSIPFIEGIFTSTSLENLVESLLSSTQANGLTENLLSVSTVTRFAVAKYTPQGNLDTTFNPGSIYSPTRPGIVITPIGLIAEAKALIKTFDKKLVAGGFSIDVSQSTLPDLITAISDITLAKYNTDGSLDTTFNSTGARPGIVTTRLNGDGVIYGITEDEDNNIVAAGSLNDSNFLIARYLPIGELDPTFNPLGDTPGVVITNFVNPNFFEIAIAYSVIIDDNGNILVAGIRQTTQTATLALVRYLPDGSLDSSFGDGGFVNIPIPFANIVVDALTIDKNNKIIVSAFTRNTNVTDRDAINFNQPFILFRLNEEGTFDTTFTPIGLTPIVPVEDEFNTIDAILEDVLFNIFSDVSNSVILDSKGNILVAGYVNYAFIRNLVILARYLPNGTLDTTFNSRGSEGIIDNPNVNNPNDDQIFPGDPVLNSLFNSPYFIFPPGIVVTNTFFDTSDLRFVIGGGSSAGNMQIKRLIEAGGSALFKAESEMTPSQLLLAPIINFPTKDLVVSENSIVMRGTSEPYSFIRLSLDDAKPTEIYVGGEGTWQYQTPTLIEGEHSVKIISLDNTGAPRGSSPLLKFFVSSIALNPPTITTPISGTFKNKRINVQGYSQPGFTVVVFLNNQIVGTTNSNPSGYWSLELENLNEGKYELTSLLTDGINRVSPKGNSVYFNIESDKSDVPIITSPTVNQNIANSLTIKGTGKPNSNIILNLNNKDIAKIKVDEAGNWNYNMRSNFKPGSYALYAYTIDDKGQRSSNTSVINFIGGIHRRESTVHLGDRSITTDTTISGKTKANSRVKITIDNINQKTIKADKDGNWIYTIAKKNFSKGFHNIKFLVPDVQSNLKIINTLNISI